MLTRVPNPANNPYWERIEEIMWYYLFRTASEFSRHIGLRRTENLYQIKRGNNRISLKLADMICERLPEVSKGWLLTGEHRMLLNE